MRWLLLWLLSASPAAAQIDPKWRQLVQLGWDQPLSGGSPLGYGFYYLNRPKLYQRGLTLRLVAAPVYADGELGFKIAPQTDVGIGLSGGGFAFGHQEIRRGSAIRAESFNGNGFALALAMYRRMNPGKMIPLYLYLKGMAGLRAYESAARTDPNFVVPQALFEKAARIGLRFGGREPELHRNALELSVWYEGRFRDRSQQYGYGDRSIRHESQLFWSNAYVAYTFPATGRFASAAATLGTSSNADRLSAWRLGGSLPLVAEYPLALPGYVQLEVTARSFAHLEVRALTPVDEDRKFGVGLWGAAASVDYLPGFEQTGSFNSGVGAWSQYDPGKRWRLGLQYGYGIGAMRDFRRGAHSVGMTVQINLGAPRWAFPFEPRGPVQRPPTGLLQSFSTTR
ncbi:MAG: hypothetical protein HY553_19680 [Elusimicrobia bacterium]|nr:hypothetical protein [Elusimicrobiota bacterium]